MKKIFKTTININDKEVLNINSYTIIEVEYVDGTRSLHRQNIQFEGFRLLGIMDFAINEIRSMLIPNQSHWTKVERKFKGKDSSGKIIKND